MKSIDFIILNIEENFKLRPLVCNDRFSPCMSVLFVVVAIVKLRVHRTGKSFIDWFSRFQGFNFNIILLISSLSIEMIGESREKV